MREKSITIEFIDCLFINNSISIQDTDNNDKFDVYFNHPPSVLYFRIIPTSQNTSVSIKNITISNITGRYSSIVFFNTVDKPTITTIEIHDSTFANNSIYSSDYYDKGTVVIRDTSYALISNCSFLNNFGTGLLISNSLVHFNKRNVFRENRAYNGGGLALYWGSRMYLMTNATLIFENNLASGYGGGLYVKKCTEVDNFHSCFIPYYADGAALQFYNNSANIAANDMYAGDLYTCSMNDRPGWLAIADITQSSHDHALEVASDPLHVCDCSDKSTTQDCINIVQTIKTLQTYPGRVFTLSVMAVGQLLNNSVLSGVPSSIYASLLPRDIADSKMTPGQIPLPMQIQKGKRECSELSYQINTTNGNEVMVLAVDVNKSQEYYSELWKDHARWHSHAWNVLSHHLIMPAYIQVNFLPCPVEFELSPEGACICSPSLEGYVLGCSIDTVLITRKLSYWIAIKSQDNSSPLFLTHKHCPFDYCRPGSFDFSLDDANMQCTGNRSGIICGACQPGYSMILGSTECRECTNHYILLLIPFTVAGVLLIAFLSLTDMTVAAGNINGLLFYANVVMQNKATFFHPDASESFLAVFMAWLNLDFGINSCFYDGLDAYVYMWLQFSFPMYIWFLAIAIIVACRHFDFMNKLCGTNIVQVLATLFLLSYTKLQNTISRTMSFTVVHVSNGESMLVWLVDGNIPYLQGKHIALFLINFLFLLALLGYTLSIMLGPWLQRKTQYKGLFWVLKMKPLFDAYYGPLKDNHRYWTGVLLLSRLILSLVSAVNVLGDDSINLLGIVMISMLLLLLLGNVYKNVAITVLDGFFFLNLGFLASLTLFNKLFSAGSQYATIFVSTGSTFAIFCITLLYHCSRRIKAVAAKTQQPPLNHDHEDSADEMLNAIDTNRT